jgi:hypothetical protein
MAQRRQSAPVITGAPPARRGGGRPKGALTEGSAAALGVRAAVVYAARREAGDTEPTALAAIDRLLRAGLPPLSKATWRKAMQPHLTEFRAQVKALAQSHALAVDSMRALDAEAPLRGVARARRSAARAARAGARRGRAGGSHAQLASTSDPGELAARPCRSVRTARRFMGRAQFCAGGAEETSNFLRLFLGRLAQPFALSSPHGAANGHPRP